ncbi:hypothetical protein K438DRAFT_1771952 [Mycena galopus ATCC 62051]|nr:hypothetical protein K438DRAFT_1771952 [Mycena galopus ATCC 62051]
MTIDSEFAPASQVQHKIQNWNVRARRTCLQIHHSAPIPDDEIPGQSPCSLARHFAVCTWTKKCGARDRSKNECLDIYIYLQDGHCAFNGAGAEAPWGPCRTLRGYIVVNGWHALQHLFVDQSVAFDGAQVHAGLRTSNYSLPEVQVDRATRMRPRIQPDPHWGLATFKFLRGIPSCTWYLGQKTNASEMVFAVVDATCGVEVKSTRDIVSRREFMAGVEQSEAPRSGWREVCACSASERIAEAFRCLTKVTATLLFFLGFAPALSFSFPLPFRALVALRSVLDASPSSSSRENATSLHVQVF